MTRKVCILCFIFSLTHYFSLPGWAAYTNSRFLTLVVSASDQGSGMGTGAQMKFSNDGQTWSVAEPFAMFRENWDITAFGGGAYDGLKTVCLKLKDSAGNWSVKQMGANIILDRTIPLAGASPTGGAYNAPQSITLSADETCRIYYTKDGSTPTTSSAHYVAPIIIDKTTILKFFASDLAKNRSQTITETYIIPNDMPDTDADGMPDWWEIDYGLNPHINDADHDNDSDGYTNLEEYLAGWNPTHYAMTLYVDDDANPGGDGTRRYPFNNIHKAIEQAVDADTILVLEGNYLESQGLFMRERVDLISNAGYECSIDLAGSGFIEAASYSAISGFKIINPLNGVGAISCFGSSPTISNNLIIPSTYGSTGILLTDSSSAKIINNTILDADNGIEIDSASPVIMNNIIVDNYVGIRVYDGSPVIDYNNIWGNAGTESCPDGDYCGINPGAHDISDDPIFVDETIDDYHLQAGSPCIDTGTPENAPLNDCDGNIRPQGQGYDMGYDEYVFDDGSAIAPPSHLWAGHKHGWRRRLSGIHLIWRDNSDNEDGFIIERKLNGCNSNGTWNEIATVPVNTDKYTDWNVTPNTRYSYRLRAYNSHGYSDYSECTSAKTKYGFSDSVKKIKRKLKNEKIKRKFKKIKLLLNKIKLNNK